MEPPATARTRTSFAEEKKLPENFVRLTIDDGLARLTLTRPEAGNAMDLALIEQFSAAAVSLTGRADVRAVLIDAEGRNFCVGGDIRAMHGSDDPGGLIRRMADRIHEGVLALANLPAPVITCVQGAAAGAGFSVAVGGDIAIAGESASFTLAYAGIGLTADGGATWLLPRLVGLRVAQDLTLNNRRVAADEAQRIGLVTRVVPDAELASVALAEARRLAAGPTRTYGAIKALLAGADRSSLAEHLDAESRAIEAAMRRPDAREGITAFVEKRRPAFRGE